MQKIEYMAIENLIPHPDNPRKVDEHQMDILCQSITDNADYFEARPILCNKGFVVFAGNMRLMAAKNLGLKEVPVAVMDISEERQKEIMIRDNRSNGMWDFDILANKFEMPDLTKWGFNESELVGASADTDPEHEGDDCVRCVELRDMVAGHSGRAGHEVFEKKEGEQP
jgi:hypothetical protein